MVKKEKALLVYGPAAKRIQERVAQCSQTPAQLAAKIEEVDKSLEKGNRRRAKGTPVCSDQFDKVTFGSLPPSEMDRIVQASAVHMQEVVKARAQSMGLTVSEYTNGFL